MRLFHESQNRIDIRFINGQVRDIVLILPGGGYQRTSPREGIPVANIYEAAGFHTAIYHYRETLLTYFDLIHESKILLDQLKNLPQVRKVFILGFSAGGHLACMLSEMFPDIIKGTVLSYPVITSDDRFSHKDSIVRLFGGLPTKEHKALFSLEHHVHAKMSPVFVWHTMDDRVVPVENTLRLVYHLRKKGVKVECHLYPKGPHGLSLGTKETSFEDMDPNLFESSYKDISSWVHLSMTFLKGC